MRLAREGYPQMAACTVVLCGAMWLVSLWWWPAALPLLGVWVWSIAFFRDPKREGVFAEGELCSPADGTVQDICEFEEYPSFEGPVVRVGIFLSLFDVHINRSPCAGRVRSVVYRPGKFYAAMKAEAVDRNESNALVIDPHGMLPGPVGVRQIVGMAARRIVCHAREGTELKRGERFGLIKFGSRTELIVPKVDGMEILVKIGDKVRAGLTPLVRQPLTSTGTSDNDGHSEDVRRESAKAPQATA